MKEMRGIHKFTWLVPSAARCAALAVALGVTTAAQAVTKPLAVWNADFANASTRGTAGWKMYTYSHDITDGVLTIDSTSSSGLIVETDSDKAVAFPVSVVAALSNVPNATEGVTNALVSIRAATSLNYNSATYDNNFVGILLEDNAKYQAMYQGEPYAAPESNTYPTDGGTHWFSFIDRNSSGNGGVNSYLDGTVVQGYSTLKSANYPYARAVTLGGLYGSTKFRSTDMKISYLAIVPTATVDDVDYWRLADMTSAETVASDATSFIGGTGVGVNLNGGTISVTSGQTAYALFVQDDTTLEVPLAANALAITKPLYVADGKTLTVKLSGTISASATTTVVAAGNIFGDVVVDASAIDDTNYVVTTTVGTSAISVTCRRKVIWNGGENGDWGTVSNWLLGDNTVPSAAPSDTTKNGGDHVIFNTPATVSIGNRQATVSRITLNADVTFVGRSLAQGNGLFFDEMDGDGKLTLNGVWVATISEGNGRTVTIRNDVCIAADSYFNGASLVNHIYGNLTGSGNLAYHLKGGEAAHLWLHGDNSGYSGTLSVVRDGGAYSRIDLDGAQASSANAVWSFECYAGSGKTSQNTTYVVKSTDTYYFGGITGGFHVNGYDAHIEIGAREDYASTFNYATRANRQYGYITKVGSNTLTLNGTPYYVTLKGGTTTLGASFNYGSYNSQSTTLVFEGSGASLIVSPKTENDVTTYPDVSGYIKNSSAPVAFDTAGNDFTWATALAASNVGGLTKKGAGTLTLTAIPRYSGATRVEEGTLVVPLGTSLGDVYVAEGAKLTVDLTGATSSSAFLTCASMENNGTVNWINAPDGITPQAVETDGKYFIAVPRTLTWSGAGDDTAWTTAGNWLVGEDAATLAPQPFDSVLFNTTTPGVTLSAAAEVASVTAPNGLTLATAYDLTVYDDFTVTGAFVKSGDGTLSVGGTFAATSAKVTKGALEAGVTDCSSVVFESVELAGNGQNNSTDTISVERGYHAKMTFGDAVSLSSFSGVGVVEGNGTITVNSDSNQSFIGSLTGDMSFVKEGNGTLTLFGQNSFTGDFTISAGTVKFSTPYDLSGLSLDYDASNEDSVTTESDVVTKWAASYGSNDLTPMTGYSDITVGSSTTLFNGKPYLTSERFGMTPASDGRVASTFMVVAVPSVAGNKALIWNDGDFMSGDKYDSYKTQRFSLYANTSYGIGCYWNYNAENNGIWVNGTYGGTYELNKAFLVSTSKSPIRRGDQDRAFRIGMWQEAKDYDTTMSFGEVLTYNRGLSLEEHDAVDAYLMQKWGIASCSSIPATADVTVAAGATLDLGGQTVTVASLNLSGTIQNGTIIVTGNNLTIANSTAAITATVKISGYDSSMTAPAGFSFTGNGDGTATLVDNRATATLTWTATENGGNWSDASNWDLGVAPGSGNAVVFPSGEYTVYIDTATAACAGMSVTGTVEFAQTDKSTGVHNVIRLYGAVTGEGTVKLHHVGVENQSGAALSFAPALVIEAPTANPASDSWFNTAAFEFGGNVTVEAGGRFIVYAAKPTFGAVTVTLGEGAYMGDWADKGFTFNGTTVVGSSGTGAYLWAGNGGANSPIDGTGVTFQGVVTINYDYTNTKKKNYFDTTISATAVSMASGASITMKTENLSITSAPAATTSNHEIVVSTDSTAGTTTYTNVDNTTSTWVGSSGDSWNDATKWSTGVLPKRYTDVTIPETFNGTIYITSGAWPAEGDREIICRNLTVKGTVTLQELNTGWCYLTLFGDVNGSGSLTIKRAGLDNMSGRQLNVGCKLYVDYYASSDSYCVGEAGFVFEDVGVWSLFKLNGATTFKKLTLGTNADIVADAATAVVTIETLVIESGATPLLEINSGTLTLAGTVTLQGTGSTLTVPAGANVSGATFTTSVNGCEVVGPTENVYSVAVSTVVAPGATSIEYATEKEATTAAAGYTVALTAAQETQGLLASYYTTAVVPGATEGTYVVTAVLDASEVAPEIDTSSEPMTVTSSGVSFAVDADSLKAGLYYGVGTRTTPDGEVTYGGMTLFTGSNADDINFTADLPNSGVLYYTIEASDTDLSPNP